MLETATISSKFQISVPKRILVSQNWKAGQELAFVPQDGGVMLVRVPKIEELFGVAKGADPTGYRDEDD